MDIDKAKKFIEIIRKATDGLETILNGDIQQNSVDYREIARKYAIETGVDPEQIINTINEESKFDPLAKGVNTNGSTDGGICQINDEGGIGPNCKSAKIGEFYFSSTDYVLNNPIECIKGMCLQFKKGRAKDWYGGRKLYAK